MIFMGNSARAMIVWGIVSIVILLISYLLIVKPILDDTDEQIDRAFDQSEQLQEDAFDSAEEIQESIQDDVDEAIEQGSGGGGGGKGGNATVARAPTISRGAPASRSRTGRTSSSRTRASAPSAQGRASRAPQKSIEFGSSGSTRTVIVLPASTPLIEPCHHELGERGRVGRAARRAGPRPRTGSPCRRRGRCCRSRSSPSPSPGVDAGLVERISLLLEGAWSPTPMPVPIPVRPSKPGSPRPSSCP